MRITRASETGAEEASFVVNRKFSFSRETKRAAVDQGNPGLLLLPRHVDGTLRSIAVGDLAAAAMVSERESGSFFSRVIFTDARAARRRANGSL